MKIIDDILDLVVAIFLLGLTISIAFTVVLPIFYEDKEQVGLVDKTSPEFLGYDLDSTYDGSMSYLDVILSSQLQDFNLPEPKQFTIATDNPDMVVVDSTYSSSFNLNEVKSIMTTLLDREGTKDSRYRVQHNYGLSTNNSTNLARNGNMETVNDFNSGLDNWNYGSTLMDSAPSQITGTKVISGTRSLAITSPKASEEGYLYQNITSVTPNAKYQLSADLYCENCTATIRVVKFTYDGAELVESTSEEARNTTKATSKNLKIEFEVSSNIRNFVIEVIKKKNETGSALPETMVVDNIEFKVFENSDPYYEFVRVQ